VTTQVIALQKGAITHKGVIAINKLRKAIIPIVVLAFIAECAPAAQKITTEKKGTYVYWFTFKDAFGNDQVTQPVKFKGRSAILNAEPLGIKFSGAKLHVMDKRTGNLAIKDYEIPKDPKSVKPIVLKSDDFQYVRTIRLKIVSKDGAPVESGLVEITDGEGTPMRAVITPADQGVALFENVANGEINVKVKAKGLEKTIDSDIELPAKRKTPNFEREIRVSGDVDTLPMTETKPAAATSQETRPETGNTANAILQTIAGLIFLTISITVIYFVLKSKGVTAQHALKKMGVQFPESTPATGTTTGAEATPSLDPNICPFCGQRKDPTGNCACTISPAATLAHSPGNPRLVGTQGTYSGRIFEITSESVTIGRDQGNSIALAEDSTVSRRHATITKTDSEYTIRDEGSSNGTFVNGARITEQKLRPGDEVQIGGTRFRFET